MRAFLKDRYVVLLIFFSVVCLAIVLQLINLQILHGEKYQKDSMRRIFKKWNVSAPRGEILDRNYAPIGVNRTTYSIEIIDTKLSNAELNEMLLKVFNLFKKNNEDYLKSFENYIVFDPFEFGKSIPQNEDDRNKLFLNTFGIKDSLQIVSQRDLFDYLRNTKYKIDQKYSDEEAYKIMLLRFETRNYSAYDTVLMAKDVKQETIAQIQERNQEFPGMKVKNEYSRGYIDGWYIAHVLGYVGLMNDKEYTKWKPQGYAMNDTIGKSGIELAAESYLRGKPGVIKVEEDIWGKQTDVVNNAISGELAIPGKDVIMTIDMKLQKTAMDSLARNIEKIRTTPDKKNFGDANAGAAVAIDVNSGEVLAMASYPSYDPSIFIAGSYDNEAIKALNKDKSSPSFNRAIQGTYTPGSTFKPLIGIAGLEEGIISPSYSIYNDSGTVKYGDMVLKCMEFRDYGYVHGDLNLKKALETSCNIYFHKLGVDVKIDKIDKWAKIFGLGELTGIDIGSEEKGFRSNLETKKIKERNKNEIWYTADTAQSSIGQLYNLFSPLQLANYTATIANSGKKYTPHIIKKVISQDGSIEEIQPKFETIPVKSSTIDAVKEGMVAVANASDGTAKEVFKDFSFEVAAKTGTAEGGPANASSNALFICYAPADNPKIAVAVVVEKGVWGANAAPIAKDILTEYFNINNKSGLDDKVIPDDFVFTR